MRKQIAAALLAVTLGATSLAPAPARADTEDVAKVLLGAGVLYLLGREINDHYNEYRARRAPQAAPRTPTAAPAYCEFRTQTGGRYYAPCPTRSRGHAY